MVRSAIRPLREVPHVTQRSQNNRAVAPQPVTGLPRAGRALVEQVKGYERGVVEAAMTGDAGLAGVALAQHPLVPGITAARELIAEYREAHGEHLDYLR